MNEQDKSLMPQSDMELELTGAPEEFGFPANPTVRQLRCWHNQERFLEEFGKCGIISHAAKAAGVTISNVEWWDSTDLYGFKKRKTWAAQIALGYAERELYRRAIEGIDTPVIYKGEITTTYKTYSDNLLMFLIKKMDPSYRDNYQPQVAPQIGNMQVVINYPEGYEPQPRYSEIVEGKSRALPEPEKD